MEPPVDYVLGAHVMVVRHHQVRKERLGRGCGYRPVDAREFAGDPDRPHLREQPELAFTRRSRAPIGQVDDPPLLAPLDRGVRRVDEALKSLRQPMIAPRLPVIAIHALLDDDPAAVVRDDEAVEIKVESVLHGRTVDLRDQPARPCQRCPVDADAIPDRRKLHRSGAAVLTPPATDVMPSSPDKGARPRFSAPMTLVVMPDECQSMPITAPNDWNQKGCARRRSNSSRPYSRTIAQR
jgi:hypothetical protein